MLLGGILVIIFIVVLVWGDKVAAIFYVLVWLFLKSSFNKEHLNLCPNVQTPNHIIIIIPIIIID